MRKLQSLAVFLCTLLVSFAWGQEMSRRFTNQDVIGMAQAGVSDDVIIAKIRSVSQGDGAKFDTGVEGLKALKAANVSDAVIKVMIDPNFAAAVARDPSATASDPNLPPKEIGVYWKDGPSFVFLEGQTLSHAKVGGRAASIFSEGIRGQHWDAVLDGPTSKHRVKDRHPTFYLYVPDGASAADFVLVKLNKKSDRREFQIGSFGGIGGGKSGVKPSEEVAISSEHVAVRTYRITLNGDLKAGEYAFFMGTGEGTMMSSGHVSSSSGGSASGRVYDFSVPE